jgi:hypothetical protein
VLGAGWFILSTALQAMLALAVAVNVLALGVGVWTARVMSGWQQDPARFDSATVVWVDVLRRVSLLGQTGTFVVTGVLFVVWLFQAHRSDRMQTDFLERGSGWAIGGWFVPVLGMWRPRQMVQDVRHGATGGQPGPTSTRVNLWWTAYLACFVTALHSLALTPDPELRREALIHAIGESAIADAVDAGVICVAGVLAILVVRQVTVVVRDSVRGVRSRAA